MATLRIPTPPFGVFGYVYRIQLDGLENGQRVQLFYRFQYKWNPRSQHWNLDIGDDQGVATVRNLAMLIGDEILEPYKALRVPQGNLRVVDTQGTGVEAARDEFGDRVRVLYDEPS